MHAHPTIPTELTEYSGFELKKHVEKLIYAIGIPRHLKGYSYLSRAVEIVYTEPSAIRNVVAGLYRHIADEYKTSVSCVERNCRTAIKLLWQNGDISVLEEYFPCTDSDAAPAAREFIALLADKLRRNLIGTKSDVSIYEEDI